MSNHYYNISFMDEGARCRSVIITTEKARVTARDIASAYMALDLSENTVVMAVSYLGHMGEEEYSTGVAPARLLTRLTWAACCIFPFLVLALVVWLNQ